MEAFSSVFAYCQHLKSLSDQLKNVDFPVDNSRLVLQLVFSLTEPYKRVATLIRQSDPLPQFYQARSILVLEEFCLKKAAQTSSSAMVARDLDESQEMSDHSSARLTNNGGKQYSNRGNSRKNRNNTGGCDNSGAGKGGFGGGGKSGGGNNRGGGQQQPQNNPWPAGQQWPWPWMQWVVPPCPYPATPWARPNYQQTPRQQPGILGSRPQQAYTATTPTPTGIEAAMHTLDITPPDLNWYMDTGATSHMTSTSGNLTSYFNMSNHRGITIGNGQSIPIRGYG